MKQKLKSKIIKKDVTDLKGYTIRKGTKIFIIKEFDLVHFRTKINEHFTKCLVDNGTDNYNLMPETVFKQVIE
tara:strand:- start:439 stop:657 length:219 start_codon:yes stop_codon:yes gene_type:complete